MELTMILIFSYFCGIFGLWISSNLCKTFRQSGDSMSHWCWSPRWWWQPQFDDGNGQHSKQLLTTGSLACLTFSCQLRSIKRTRCFDFQDFKTFIKVSHQTLKGPQSKTRQLYELSKDAELAWTKGMGMSLDKQGWARSWKSWMGGDHIELIV